MENPLNPMPPSHLNPIQSAEESIFQAVGEAVGASTHLLRLTVSVDLGQLSTLL